MNRYLTGISILFLFFLVSCSNDHRPRFSADDQVTRLQEELSLSDQQAEKIKPVLEERFDKMRSLRDQNLSNDQRREKIREIMEDTDKRIKENLDDEQKKKYDELQEERRQRRWRNRDQ